MNYIILSILLLSIILIAPVIVIYSMTLKWIDKLEKTKCSCSNDYKRDYIKYYLYIYLAFVGLNILLIILFAIFVNNANAKILKLFRPFIMIKKFIMPFFAIINIIFSIMYIHKLKELDCSCSEDIIREIYYYWNIIMVAIVVIILLFSIVNGIQTFYLYPKYR
jgi:hypothetical protein